MFDSDAFHRWYKRHLLPGAEGTFIDGIENISYQNLKNWIALDPQLLIVDQDDDANALLERISVTQPIPSDISIVYKFPPEFI